MPMRRQVTALTGDREAQIGQVKLNSRLGRWGRAEFCTSQTPVLHHLFHLIALCIHNAAIIMAQGPMSLLQLSGPE